MALTLRGDRNQCAGCGEYFNSSAAFDKHRHGDFGKDRRCRTVDGGFWVTALNPMDYPMHSNFDRPHGWELVG